MVKDLEPAPSSWVSKFVVSSQRARNPLLDIKVLGRLELAQLIAVAKEDLKAFPE